MSGIWDVLEHDCRRALAIRNLDVAYGSTRVVHDVTLVVEPGRVVGLVGANGAGKTTLVDAVTGFLPVRSGEVLLGDESLGAMKPSRRVRAGLVRTFQNLELFDDLTVGENLTVAGAGSRRDGSFEPATVLNLLGVSHLADTPAADLSAGDLRRVALARALMCQPSCLLVDEPAAGLDHDETAELGDVLRAIASTGVGILLIDHDMSLVLKVCDDLFVLDFGELIASGNPMEVVADPRVVEAYLGSGA